MKIKTRKFKNRELIKLIKYAANFYADLLIPKQKHKIYLDINANEISADGYCTCMDLYDFEIEIHKDLTFEHMMITLAHEMVHVKQYATGELRDYVKSTSLNRWQGKIVDDSKINYWDRPWEIEAFGREFGLYARFKESTYETKGYKT